MQYPLSLFMVKNLCYIFVLIHSLAPGLKYIFRNLNCKKQKQKEEDNDVPITRCVNIFNSDFTKFLLLEKCNNNYFF